MIVHMDMDAFYASVEERENPALAEQPLVVGGDADGRGVVATCNYLAREYGVRSAMPAAEAKRRCPQAVFLRPRMSLYQSVSAEIFAIARRYTPLVEPLSLDEAFIDGRDSVRLFGEVVDIARRIKQEIAAEQGLTASMGIGPNKLIAKIASDLEKPDGFTLIGEEQVDDLMNSLPIERLWGVGRVTTAKLKKNGVHTVADLRGRAPSDLRILLGDFAEELLRRANGIDDRAVNPHSEAKSISHETTFARDISDHRHLAAVVADFSEQVARRLRKKALKARTVTLKLRYPNFRLITRARSLAGPSDSTDEVLKTALALLAENHQSGEAIRLLGVGVSGFDGNDAQPAFQQDLFASMDLEAPETPRRAVDSVADEIQNRFGGKGLKRARGLHRKGE